MKNPLVSIILPTYNGKEERISKSIDSVLNQTFKDFELIIINDASTNDIEKIVFKYRSIDSRIVYYKNEKNLKLSRTLNKGIKYAKGKYIARIDDDDIWMDDDKLERQVKFLENNPEYGLCGGDCLYILDSNGCKINEYKMKDTDSEIRNHILQVNQFAHSSVVIRKIVLNETGLYNQQYYPAEDYELWCRIGRKFKFCNLDDVKLGYRINNNGMTQKNKLKMEIMSFKIILKNKKHYPKFLKAFIVRLGGLLLPGKIKIIIAKKFKI